MGHAASSCCAKDEKPAAVEDINAGSNEPAVATAQSAVFFDKTISCRSVDSVGSMSQQSIDLTHTGSSLNLLRGIFLRKTLRCGGNIWWRTPANLTDEQLAANFALSDPVRSLDVFLSHTWLTPGRWKFLSLLVRYGWPAMLVAWASGTALSCLFTLLGALPLFYDWEFRGMGFREVLAMGFWATLAGIASSTGGLLLSPYMCGRGPQMFPGLRLHRSDRRGPDARRNPQHRRLPPVSRGATCLVEQAVPDKVVAWMLNRMKTYTS